MVFFLVTTYFSIYMVFYLFVVRKKREENTNDVGRSHKITFSIAHMRSLDPSTRFTHININKNISAAVAHLLLGWGCLCCDGCDCCCSLLMLTTLPLYTNTNSIWYSIWKYFGTIFIIKSKYFSTAYWFILAYSIYEYKRVYTHICTLTLYNKIIDSPKNRRENICIYVEMNKPNSSTPWLRVS